jgi:DNA-binding MarR family transcriptional regulator
MTSGRKKTIAGAFDNLRRVVQVVHGYSKRAEHVAGLTGPQLWAIKVLAESAPIMISELARRMYLHPSTVIGILDRLETRGLVKRARSTEDRRVVTVGLTRRGKETVKKVPSVAQGLLLNGLEELSDKDLNMIAKGLELLVGILGAQRMPPRLLFSDEVNVPHDDGGSKTAAQGG